MKQYSKFEMEFVIFRVIFAVFLAITDLSVRKTSASPLLNNGEQLNAAPHPDKPKQLSWDRAAGMKNPSRVWPNAVVPFAISAYFDPYHISLILSAMNRISEKTCVQFKERNYERDYVRIVTGEGCRSYMGRMGGFQDLTLETPGCGDYFGTVIHELLHALGLVHEQSRPDRDQYVDIVWENIIDTPDVKHNFYQYDWNEVQNLTVPYDYTSVMHYPPNAFNKNGQNTIIPKGNGRIPYEANDLSAGDVAFINFMYCNPYNG